VNYNEDESYTPTKIIFKAGISENNLIEFAAMELSTAVGWQQVPIAGSGGGHDGNTLYAYVFQMQILENHQNGKDTHLRGIKIYALDTDSAGTGVGAGNSPRHRAHRETLGDEMNNYPADVPDVLLDSLERRVLGDSDDPESWIGGKGIMSIPDFMKEPEIR
jgi:anaphase-promoting complex subunit 10